MRTFGLIGKSLSHSFSGGYFAEKFRHEGISDARYELFELESIEQFPSLVREHEGLSGLNVTVPYKSEILSFLDETDALAQRIGAVNTLEFLSNGKLKGWNTDYLGFRQSLEPLLEPHHRKALVFGSGGASRAIQTALEDLDIEYRVVSREGPLNYSQVDQHLIHTHPLLIQATPLGTSPEEQKKIDLDYASITPDHLLYDLVYNPGITAFLRAGMKQGAALKNGLEMLYLQAEASWKIWNGTPS